MCQRDCLAAQLDGHSRIRVSSYVCMFETDDSWHQGFHPSALFSYWLPQIMRSICLLKVVTVEITGWRLWVLKEYKCNWAGVWNTCLLGNKLTAIIYCHFSWCYCVRLSNFILLFKVTCTQWIEEKNYCQTSLCKIVYGKH